MRKAERRDAVCLRRGSCLQGIIGMSAVACESFQRKWYLIVGHPLADGVRRLSFDEISGIGKISAVVDKLSGKQKGRQSRRLTALVISHGAAYRIRTCDVLIRSQTLYPAEVTPHCKGRVCLSEEASSTSIGTLHNSNEFEAHMRCFQSQVPVSIAGAV